VGAQAGDVEVIRRTGSPSPGDVVVVAVPGPAISAALGYDQISAQRGWPGSFYLTGDGAREITEQHLALFGLRDCRMK
jgi:hypothetical protein